MKLLRGKESERPRPYGPLIKAQDKEKGTREYKKGLQRKAKSTGERDKGKRGKGKKSGIWYVLPFGYEP
jgi:hypothetical protein